MREHSKLQFFVKSDKWLRDRAWQTALSLQPKLDGNISSRCSGVWLFITSRENTAANGMLALSLTYMIFLCEQCICRNVFSVFFLLKVLGNEDTLLRTHCCSWCFLARANWETFATDTNCFWTKLETFFVSRTQNLCPQQMLRARANGETFLSATMCPQQCVLVFQ